MDERSARKMGHFRFGVISPLLSNDDLRPLILRLAEQAQKVWTLPDGRMRQYAVATIEDWLYDYREHGFESLINPPRRDKGTHPVIDESVCTALDELLKEHPNVQSSTILRLLDNRGLRPDGHPSDSTLYRYLRTARLQYTPPRPENRAQVPQITTATVAATTHSGLSGSVNLAGISLADRRFSVATIRLAIISPLLLPDHLPLKKRIIALTRNTYVLPTGTAKSVSFGTIQH